MSDQRSEWLRRSPREDLSRKLGVAAWILSTLVLLLVVMMGRPEFKVTLPEGWSLAFLPGVHALLNTLVAACLVGALMAVKKGNIRLHRCFVFAAMALSILFLLCYVSYHLTTPATKYGGEGALKVIYLLLLITHIVLAAVSLPFILFTFISGFTNRFATHRRLARWVFPMWFYVAITGPVCWLMLRPYYG